MLMALMVLALTEVSCGSRTGLLQDDGGAAMVDLRRPLLDRGPLLDQLPLDQFWPLDDAAGPCRGATSWGFVTDAPYTKPPNLDREFSGVLAYDGPITVPLASSPLFTREVQLVDDYSGQVQLVLQYYMPPGHQLPVRVGEVYTFILRRRQMFEGQAEALVIRRPTSGLWPLLFAGDPAAYGQALDFDDTLIAPLTLSQRVNPDCGAPSACGAGARTAWLRFRATTGAGISEVELEQNESGAISMMGTDYRAMNVASHIVALPCADESRSHASWFLIAQKY